MGPHPPRTVASVWDHLAGRILCEMQHNVYVFPSLVPKFELISIVETCSAL